MQDAILAPIELIGNANAEISCLGKERIVTRVHKALLPLARDDEHFAEAAPHLFGSDVAKH